MVFGNIYPVELDFEEFTIDRVDYSDELLKELRHKHNATHSFFRNGNYIYISNKSGEELNIGSAHKFSLYESPEITLSIMRHIFFKSFLERFQDRIPVSFLPFRILSTRDVDDWVFDMIPANLQNRIGYKKQIELQLKFLELNNKPQFAIVVNVERRWIFQINCKEFADFNFNPVGYDVVHAEVITGLQNVLAPNEEFIGRLTEIKGDIGVVAAAGGDIEIKLTELFLKKSTHNIKSFLISVCGEQQVDKIFKKIRSSQKESLRHRKQSDEIKKIVDNFCFTSPKLADEKINYLNKDGFTFIISNIPFSFSNSFTLRNPTFVYDKSAVKINDISADTGLSKFGPYDSNVFHAKSPNILAICHKNNRGRFTNFLQNLFDGVTDSRYFTKGLKGKFELHAVQSQVMDVSSYAVEEYTKALAAVGSQKPDLVIVEIDDMIKFNDPLLYYKIKAIMLTREIPMQVVLKSRIDGFNEFILNSIALQLYAKLGGVPWVLKSSMSVDREIVIGIGHSILRKNSYAGAEQDRVVGITTFFSSDGQYLLSNKAKDVPYENYFQELLMNLKESFQALELANNWKEGDTIRLIFHIFKPIKNLEFDVVAALVKEFAKFKIQFAFVTVSKVHPYILFDTQGGGKRTFRNGIEHIVGEYVPARGTNLLLNRYSCLVQMLGGKEVKSEMHGSSNPLLVQIRIPSGDEQYKDIEPLLFLDLQYVVQQIYSFTHLSWRNYLPSEHPATMLYSELIARQLGRLRKVEGWSPDILNFSLKAKKWFL